MSFIVQVRYTLLIICYNKELSVQWFLLMSMVIWPSKMILTMSAIKFGVCFGEGTEVCYSCGFFFNIIRKLCIFCTYIRMMVFLIDKTYSKIDVDVLTFQLGLSIPHAWIRCFETLLHVSYRLKVKMWQVREENKRVESR